MIVSTNQPYFFAYPGFFYKANLSDIFVILDDIQFPRGTTWVTRNRFKNDQGTLWMTIPVWKKGLGLQKINEVRICDEGRWAKKHLESLKSAYARAPYLVDHLDFVEGIFSSDFKRLIDLNLTIIRYLIEHLHIKTDILLLSELGIESRGDQLLIDICRRIGASHFLTQNATLKFLNVDIFNEAGIQLRSFNPPSLVYPQLFGDFIPNLSTLDLILNCGPKAHDILISG
jgi:hypothetical protein